MGIHYEQLAGWLIECWYCGMINALGKNLTAADLANRACGACNARLVVLADAADDDTFLPEPDEDDGPPLTAAELEAARARKMDSVGGSD